MPHVDDGTLHAWIDGAIAAPEAAAVETHLDACESCAARLAEARALRDQADAILASDAPVVARPPFEEIVAMAGGARGGGDLTGASGRGRWLPALGWAASVAFAVAVGWIARDIARPAEEPDIMASAERTELAVEAPQPAAPQEPAAEQAFAGRRDQAIVDRRAEGLQGQAAAPPPVAATAVAAPPPPAAARAPALEAGQPGGALVPSRELRQETGSDAPIIDVRSARQVPEALGASESGASAVAAPQQVRPDGGGRQQSARPAVESSGAAPTFRSGIASTEPAAAAAPALPPTAREAATDAVTGSVAGSAPRAGGRGGGRGVGGDVGGGGGGGVGGGVSHPYAANSGWRFVPRTEAAAVSGRALWGIASLEPAQTGYRLGGPSGAIVLTDYLLESGATVHLVQELESASARQNLSMLVLDQSPAIWTSVQGNVRVTLWSETATAQDLAALATRLNID